MIDKPLRAGSREALSKIKLGKPNEMIKKLSTGRERTLTCLCYLKEI